MNMISKFLTSLALLSPLTTNAAIILQGENADGSANNSCGNSCALVYDSNLNLTILNNFSLGAGLWDTTASAESAQSISENAGAMATGLTGWVLPTGDGTQMSGASNQWLGILQDAGGNIFGLESHFAGVFGGNGYWSSTEIAPGTAWGFSTQTGNNYSASEANFFEALAVRSGQISAVPQPGAAWLMLTGLVGLGVMARRRTA